VAIQTSIFQITFFLLKNYLVDGILEPFNAFKSNFQ